LPLEVGFTLPQENVGSDANIGGEISLNYRDQIGSVNFSVGGNLTYSRRKFLESYKPRFANSWDHYRNSKEDRWDQVMWGYVVEDQFESIEQINNWPVDVDGRGNTTMLPGDLIYKDFNGDGIINQYDERPIGYLEYLWWRYYYQQPILMAGFNFNVSWKGFDFSAIFTGAGMYSLAQELNTKTPFAYGGSVPNFIIEDRWHREDLYDPNSEWIPGKFPVVRWQPYGHSNNGPHSTFWNNNVYSIRPRSIELGYTLPANWIRSIDQARIFINGYNLFSLDNLRSKNLDPEIMNHFGNEMPAVKIVNFGASITL